MTFQFPKTPKQLTKAESLILDYVSNHTEAFLFSSIGQLAKQLGVSEATVSRCVRHVGCKNFKEFKQLVIRGIEQAFFFVRQGMATGFRSFLA